MQNSGIIQLRDPLRLIYSIGLQQKSNSGPLNPEPMNSYAKLNTVHQQYKSMKAKFPISIF